MSRDGKKTGGRDFLPGNPGGPGAPRITLAERMARKVTASVWSSLLNKYMSHSKEELEEAKKDTSLPIIELIIIGHFLDAHKKADPSKFEVVLQRAIGKVPEKPPEDLADPENLREKLAHYRSLHENGK